jgi:glycosyltransferase involved in cell wall biosynthesis
LNSEIINNVNICAVIPTYNNANTLSDVVTGVKKYIDDVIVIVDGSTDDTVEILNSIMDITIISFEKNKGKGAALKAGIKKSLELGFDHMLTIDSDGQHSCSDIPVMLKEIEHNPDSLIIGSRNIQADGMPGKNTFANKFSNFWFWAETNIKLPDTQSGFRIYPIKKYKKTHFFTNKFEFEIEILVRSAWSDIKIIPVPVSVYYAPEDERISHFRPLPDFTRISILNTVLVLITFIYILPLRAFKYLTKNKFTKVVKEQIALHNENSLKISSAIGFGLFMGIIPIWGFQMLIAALMAHLMKLNKIVVLAFSNISIPPMIPVIIYLSYKMGGLVLDNPQQFNADTIKTLRDQVLHGTFYETMNEFGYSIFQYIVGSFIFATIMGAIGFIISYTIIKFVQRK